MIRRLCCSKLWNGYGYGYITWLDWISVSSLKAILPGPHIRLHLLKLHWWTVDTQRITMAATIPTQPPCIELPARRHIDLWESCPSWIWSQHMSSAACFVTGTECISSSSMPLQKRFCLRSHSLAQPVVRAGRHLEPCLGRASGSWYKSATWKLGNLSK